MTGVHCETSWIQTTWSDIFVGACVVIAQDMRASLTHTCMDVKIHDMPIVFLLIDWLIMTPENRVYMSDACWCGWIDDWPIENEIVGDVVVVFNKYFTVGHTNHDFIAYYSLWLKSKSFNQSQCVCLPGFQNSCRTIHTPSSLYISLDLVSNIHMIQSTYLHNITCHTKLFARYSTLSFFLFHQLRVPAGCTKSCKHII
jgi:hypothetical protein